MSDWHWGRALQVLRIRLRQIDSSQKSSDAGIRVGGVEFDQESGGGGRDN